MTNGNMYRLYQYVIDANRYRQDVLNDYFYA